MEAQDGYRLPDELARHAPRGRDIAYAGNLVSLRELEGRGEVSLEDSPNLRAWMGRLEDRGSYEAAV